MSVYLSIFFFHRKVWTPMLFWCVSVFSNMCDVSTQDTIPVLVDYPAIL